MFATRIRKGLTEAILFLFCLLALSDEAKAVQWIYLAKAQDGNMSVFIDRDSILQVSENVVKSCQKFAYAKPILISTQNKSITQIVACRQWDCVEEKYNNLQVTFHFIDGTKETETYKFALWHYIKQDTPEYDLYDFVCNQD
jgi:hypothetical protein